MNELPVVTSEERDIPGWLELAREVEPLFGPMADEVSFREALLAAINDGNAYCIRDVIPDSTGLLGAVVISRKANEILWLAVTARKRGYGLGTALIHHAMEQLNRRTEILVHTFAPSVEEGRAARKLYLRCGFVDKQEAGFNPAGIPTVIMACPPVE